MKLASIVGYLLYIFSVLPVCQAIWTGQELRDKIQEGHRTWPNSRLAIYPLQIFEQYLNGDLNLHKRARLGLKYDPTTDEEAKFTRRNIIRIVEKDFVPDILFLSNMAWEAAGAANSIVDAILEFSRVAAFWQTMEESVQALGMNDDLYVHKRNLLEEIHEKLEYLAQAGREWEELAQGGSVESLMYMCQVVVDTERNLEAWFPENTHIAGRANVPLDLAEYFRVLVKQKHDNAWWMRFIDHVRIEKTDAGWNTPWSRQFGEDRLAIVQGGPANSEDFLKFEVLQKIEEYFRILIAEALQKPSFVVLKAIIGSSQGDRNRYVMRAETNPHTRRELRKAQVVLRGRDGRHGISEMLEGLLMKNRHWFAKTMSMNRRRAGVRAAAGMEDEHGVGAEGTNAAAQEDHLPQPAQGGMNVEADVQPGYEQHPGGVAGENQDPLDEERYKDQTEKKVKLV